MGSTVMVVAVVTVQQRWLALNFCFQFINDLLVSVSMLTAFHYVWMKFNLLGFSMYARETQ